MRRAIAITTSALAFSACAPDSLTLDQPGLSGLWPGATVQVGQIRLVDDGSQVRATSRFDAFPAHVPPERLTGPLDGGCALVPTEDPAASPIGAGAVDLSTGTGAWTWPDSACSAGLCAGAPTGEATASSSWSVHGEGDDFPAMSIPDAGTMPGAALQLEAPDAVQREDGTFYVRWLPDPRSRMVVTITPLRWFEAYTTQVRCTVDDDGWIAIQTDQFDRSYPDYEALHVVLSRQITRVHPISGDAVLIATGAQEREVTVEVR